MDPNKLKDYVPFTLYDFFGYLFPGVFFSSGILWFMRKMDLKVIDSSYKHIVEINATMPFVTGFIMVILIVAIFYIVGHFIATFSHIILDRLIVSGILYYPIHRLLNSKNNIDYKPGIIYRLIIIVLIIISWLPIINIDLAKSYIDIFGYIICGLLVIKTINFFIYNSNKLKSSKLLTLYKRCKNCLNNFLSVSFDKFILLLESVIQTNRLLDEGIRSEFNKKFQSKHPTVQNLSSEQYWLPFYEIVSKNPTHATLITNWLHIYSFSRNISAASFLLSGFLIVILNYNLEFDGIKYYISILNIVAIIFYMRYWMIYYTYYTKGIIRSYVTCDNDSN
ncbi:MAG: hypothetical protein KBF59_02290 [Ignavibacterium sp.]|nr:hypothetical protein [Ignavibacterium sp.]